MTNRLLNGNFEGPWEGYRCLEYTFEGEFVRELERGQVFIPEGWDAVAYKRGLPAGDYSVPWDPNNKIGYAEPEVRYATATDPDRMRSGRKGLLAFTFSRIHDVCIMQHVQVVPGEEMELSAYAHAWSNHEGNHEDDPRWSEGAGFSHVSYTEGAEGLDDAQKNFTFSVGVKFHFGEADSNPYSDDVIWGVGVHVYNAYFLLPKLQVVVPPDVNMATVFLRSTTLWPYKHSDAYWDDASFVVVEDPVSEREYDRLVHLLPQDATREEITQVVEAAAEKKQTFTQSVDDAFVTATALKTRTVHVWNAGRISTDRATLEEWVKRFYPPLPTIVYRAFEPVAYWEDYLLWQRKPEWRDKYFGSVTYQTTFGDEGCYVTALASAMRILYLDDDATPVSVDAALGPEGYIKGTAKVLWDASRDELGIDIRKGTEQEAVNALSRGYPVMAEVLPASPQHFVLVVEDLGDGDYLMLDPYKDLVAPLHDHYNGIKSWRILSLAIEPPPPPKPDIPLYRPDGVAGYTGIQVLGSGVAGLSEFHQILTPPIAKTVLCHGEFEQIVRASPKTLLLHRHWNGRENDFKWHLGFSDHAAAAKAWCDEFMPGLIEDLRVRGLNNRRIFVESLNEIYDYDLNSNTQAVKFDIEFIYRVAEWSEDTPDFEFIPVVMIAAVGNPPLITDVGGSEHWRVLRTLGRVSVEYGAVWGPHQYWTADKNRPELFETLAPYYQHRWKHFDDVLAAAGIYVNWVFTESGPCGGTYVPETGHFVMSYSEGWKSAYGDSPEGWARASSEMLQYDRELEAYNEKLGGRIIGCTHFQAGSDDSAWAPFELEGHLIELATTIRGI